MKPCTLRKFWHLGKCKKFHIENWENWKFENITWKIRSNVVALLLTNKSLSSHFKNLKIFQKIIRPLPKNHFLSRFLKIIILMDFLVNMHCMYSPPSKLSTFYPSLSTTAWLFNRHGSRNYPIRWLCEKYLILSQTTGSWNR